MMKNNYRSYADRRHEALRLILEELPAARNERYSDREIAGLCCISKTTVGRLRRLAAEKKLDWSDVERLNECERNFLFNKLAYEGLRKRYPDWRRILSDPCRPRLSLQRLWKEYRKSSNGSTISYPHFTKLYRREMTVLSRHHASRRVQELSEFGARHDQLNLKTEAVLHAVDPNDAPLADKAPKTCSTRTADQPPAGRTPAPTTRKSS